MSELLLTVLRLGYLVLLWAFVFAVVSVLRRDLTGTRVSWRRRPAEGPSAVPAVGPRSPNPSLAGTLSVTGGPLAGTRLPLGNTSIILGRSPASTLVLDDDYSSTRHARIYPTQGAWYVEDLGSTNGTFVAGERIHGPTLLQANVPVQVGQTVVELM